MQHCSPRPDPHSNTTAERLLLLDGTACRGQALQYNKTSNCPGRSSMLSRQMPSHTRTHVQGSYLGRPPLLEGEVAQCNGMQTARNTRMGESLLLTEIDSCVDLILWSPGKHLLEDDLLLPTTRRHFEQRQPAIGSPNVARQHYALHVPPQRPYRQKLQTMQQSCAQVAPSRFGVRCLAFHCPNSPPSAHTRGVDGCARKLECSASLSPRSPARSRPCRRSPGKRACTAACRADAAVASAAAAVPSGYTNAAQQTTAWEQLKPVWRLHRPVLSMLVLLGCSRGDAAVACNAA